MKDQQFIENVLDFVLFCVCGLEIATGVQFLVVYNDLSREIPGVPEGLFTSDELIFLILAGFTVFTCLATIILPRTGKSPTHLSIIFFMTLLSFCCQFALAVISAVYSTIIQDQLALVPSYFYIPSEITLIKNELIATAVVAFVVGVPMMIVLLNLRWESWLVSKNECSKMGDFPRKKSKIIPMSIFFLIIVAAAHEASGITFLQFGQYLQSFTGSKTIYKQTKPVSSYLIITGAFILLYCILSFISSSSQSPLMANLSWIFCWTIVVMNAAGGVMTADLYFKAHLILNQFGLSISDLPEKAKNAVACALTTTCTSFILGLPFSLVMMYLENQHRTGLSGVSSVETQKQTEMLNKNEGDSSVPTPLIQ